MTEIIDGKALAARIRNQLKQDCETLRSQRGSPAGLGVILVGDDPGSATYVRNKEKAANEVGILSQVIRRPATMRQDELLMLVDELNARPDIDAFLVQLPLPKGLEANPVIERIQPEKDGDGIHPINLGHLVMGVQGPRPCTPMGIMALLDEAKTELKGARAVVIGRSLIVGKPVALMLQERHATVTLCHSRTTNLAEEVRRADVLVVATGQPAFVRGDWLKPGVTVIDVGTNRVNDKWVGDVDFAGAQGRARAITPVPGGVGPMTIAMLLRNTIQAALRRKQA
jgi:methylenetetrahydrofolate dehydrogenase (NADP+)/methenyltetrahydrofolate cyclohydrolase